MKKGVIKPWIIGMIILIISAAILIYFSTKLTQTGIEKKEACRQSVVMRSKSILGTQPIQSILPLNCQTEIIKIKISNEEEIKKRIAEALYDCWYMMGEGELDFVGEEGKKACVICSIIKFDEKLKEKKVEGIYKYMKETKIPKKNITFADYIGKDFDIEIENDILYINEDYSIVFFIASSPSMTEVLLNGIFGGIVGLKAGNILAKVGLQAGSKLFVGGIIIGLFPEVTKYIQTWIKCKEITGKCVGLLFIPYNASSLSQNCEIILSIPPEE